VQVPRQTFFHLNIVFFSYLDASILQTRLLSHTDAVWGLSAHSTKPYVLSCSADGTVKLWSPHSSVSQLNSFAVDDSEY